ncbi:MAG TPA: SDR family oxidoreductase, partial [Thermoanaerobaculia bacterium]|nr:SDR family oxidoreductase [Thermoanaerobaculia bacterium]
MFDTKILAERSVLVTGGGSGLGLAMAKKFASHGAKVTIAGRTLDRLERAAGEIRATAREGGEVDIHPADVREPAEVEALVAHAINRFGKIDSLVNNAAGNFLVTSEDLTPNGFDAVVRTVLHGSVYCTLAVGRHLLARRAAGSIVSVVTTYAWTGTGFALPSACAKAGVLAMTRSLAVEWGEAGIRLNAVAPGPIQTEGAWSRLMAFPEAEKDTLERIPLGRLGTPEELANLVTFLLSDLCPYQTGDCVTMDGGEWLAGAGEFSDYRKVPR